MTWSADRDSRSMPETKPSGDTWTDLGLLGALLACSIVAIHVLSDDGERGPITDLRQTSGGATALAAQP